MTQKATWAKRQVAFLVLLLLKLVASHECLNILGVIRNDVLAEEAAAVGGDEHIILDADTSKVLVYKISWKEGYKSRKP